MKKNEENKKVESIERDISNVSHIDGFPSFDFDYLKGNNNNLNMIEYLNKKFIGKSTTLMLLYTYTQSSDF